MPTEPNISAIAHVIQLAVAPVFLLTGIGALLGVLVNRLSRIVDRARVVEKLLQATSPDADLAVTELAVLARRARNISWSIGLCTLTALLVSAVIAVLFLSAFFSFDTSGAVALLFVGAMLALIVALVLFLREVFMATAHLRFGPR